MSGDKPCPPKLPPPCPRKCTIQEEKKEEKEEKEEKEAEPLKCKEFWHPGFDARFPNQNQTRRCWANYVDYIRCTDKFGEDYEACEYFKKAFQHLCPTFWVSNWDEQRESGTFPMPPWA